MAKAKSKAKATEQKSNVSLTGLRTMIDEISRDRNLPSSSVQAALREALLKGYERYRRSQHLDTMQFEEDYFDNFDVFLNLDEEAFQVVATKTIVEEVIDEDHEISLDQIISYYHPDSTEDLTEEELAEMTSKIGDSVVLNCRHPPEIIAFWRYI